MVVIAIDGPSGSGKSTVAKAVAKARGLAYLDTGAMYRAATLWAQQQADSLTDHARVAEAVKEMPLEVGLDPDAPTFTLAGQDITEAIRAPEVSQAVSKVATNLDVRAELGRRQREIIDQADRTGPGIVAEGRDITTIVAPDAAARILLTASPTARLARRSLELHGTDDAAAVQATTDQVLRRDAEDSTVVEFQQAAEGVTTVDSSDLDLPQTIAAVQGAVDASLAAAGEASAPDDWGDDEGLVPAERSAAPGTDNDRAHALVGAEASLPDDGGSPAAPGAEADEESRERALRAGLESFELDDEDRAILDDDWQLDQDVPEVPLPVLAVVGRPNVGKSTLVNRIIGRREAVIEDKPGVTRDRVTYTGEWGGRDFSLVDTGGWEVDLTGIESKVAEQAELAIELADAVIFVVDATTGATATDERVVELLRKAHKPVVLAANKVDGPSGEADAAYLWSLGLGEPYPVSALHGRGVGDLLDAAMAVLPKESAHGEVRPTGPRRVALIGRPNVGKSSLLNKLAGQERVVVDEQAGTTRDPVDELIEIKGVPYWFVDTAGLRRRVHQTSGADFYASLRTAAAIDKAEVAVVLVDASAPLTEQDTRVIQQVVDAGRALVIAYNKWDLMDPDRRPYLEREIDQQLVQLQWAPRVNVSAKTGWHTDRLAKAIETALHSWDTRISTGKLNAFLGELVAAHPHPVRGGKQPRILFATQASARPPRFVLFTTGFLDPAYRRFIERRLRETFGFEGTPIEIAVRVREKRRR